jgi:arylsulfatase A-like enzyme
MPATRFTRVDPRHRHPADPARCGAGARPGASYQGQPIEAPTGRSLCRSSRTRRCACAPRTSRSGYELSGNKALFKGDLKIALNNPPMGDGQWHLYDLRTDPGETKDLQQQRPQEFAAMQADYAAWAKANGVLPMPEGYNPVRRC